MTILWLPRLILAALLGVLLNTAAEAQYPDHVITAIVPFAAGSSNDTVARIIAPHLSAALGQPIIILDKPGADALIGIEYVAHAKPDGYTLLFSAGAVVIAPSLHKSVRYDPATQIMGVASIGIDPYIVAVSTKLGVNTLADLLGYLRNNPGKLNAPTGGNSSTVVVELFRQLTNTQFTLINYNGAGAATTSLLSGETDFGIMNAESVSTVSPDRVKLLAVAADKPIPSLPNIPTTVAAGLPSFTARAFFGLYMPGGTPPAITDRLSAEMAKIIAMQDVAQRLTRLGITPIVTNRPDFDARYHSDLAMWKDVVTKAKIPLAE